MEYANFRFKRHAMPVEACGVKDVDFAVAGRKPDSYSVKK